MEVKTTFKCPQSVSTSVHAVGEDYSTDSSESSSETISGITTDQDHSVIAIQPDNQLIFCEMEVNKKPVKLQIDCGSPVCILPKCYVGNTHIHPEMVNLQMWNKTLQTLASPRQMQDKSREPNHEEKVQSGLCHY